MLRSVPQPISISESPHLASGLTLRHYTAFRQCPSWQQLQSRIQSQTPELDRFGIHILASPSANREVILGDSHEYGDEMTPFDKAIIDDLILREARNVLCLRVWTIRERWHGVYAKHPQLPVFEKSVPGGVHVFVGPGGAGMTMSFGLAERAWKRWMGD
jgi:glycine/D-amino acid oxidase-like deaminating enzyme